MGSSGIGIGNLPTSPLNFTDMTRKQVINAASMLSEKGLITIKQAGILDSFACDYAAPPGKQLPLDLSVNSPVQRNYLSLIQQGIVSANAHGETQMAANDTSVLHAITPYQGKTIAADVAEYSNATSLNVLG